MNDSDEVSRNRRTLGTRINILIMFRIHFVRLLCSRNNLVYEIRKIDILSKTAFEFKRSRSRCGV